MSWLFRRELACGSMLIKRMVQTSYSSMASTSRLKAPKDDLKSLTRSPLPPLALGGAGLVPFYALPGLMIYSGAFSNDIAGIQLAYGACILSFLGGVRWGTLLGPSSKSWGPYIFAITPPIVAWASLVVPNIALADLIFVGGLGTAAYVDLTRYNYPDWFRGLRILLTTLAIGSIFFTMILSIVLPQKEKEQES